MKLEHLAPYLPYGLQGIDELGNYYFLYSLDTRFGIPCNWQNGNFIKFDNNDKIKPILRRLSDLTKEIEHNGEKFVPHIKLGGRPNLTDYDIDYLSKKIDVMSYGLITQLIEWHFDVFGLIEKGEAIDINTI